MSFQPTVLIIKEHAFTGLKYFHKTSKLTKLGTYAGSGKIWKRHLNKHGNYWKNLWISEVFYSEDECQELAIFLSEFFNIVKDTGWANLIPENGTDGGDNPAAYAAEAKAKRLQTLKKNGIQWKHSDSFKVDRARDMASSWASDSGIARKAALRKGSLKDFKLSFIGPPRPPGWFANNKLQHKCPHCAVTGDLRNMRRWHFDNCRKK
jgi:hypothetical protein